MTPCRHPSICFIPAVLVAAGIAFLSLMEQPVAAPLWTINDKLAHGLMYAALAASMMYAMVAIRRTRFAHFLLVGSCAAAYGLIMEILQHYCTRTRSGDKMDLLADCVGILTVLILIALWRRFTISR